MEAKSLRSGFCSDTTIPLIQTPKKVPSTSFAQSHSHQSASFGAHKLLAPLSVRSFRRLECIDSAEKVKNNDDKYETNFDSGITKKNLAVFLSGGGSNFRSIHAACLAGSVFGDVVVLVTNKPGK